MDIKSIKIKKNIALIAHDNLKNKMVNWCKNNKDVLNEHILFGTGTTSSIISEEVGLSIHGYNSGPFGGDQQIGSRIAEGKIDMVIFFSDPLSAHPHDPDVKALSRMAQIFDIPFANNEATADFIINSPLMKQEYERQILEI